MVGQVADLAVQIHGGSGYMREVAVERIYRDVRLLRLYEGTSEIQRLIIGGGLVRQARNPAGDMTGDPALPLAGVTVVALEQAVAAPLATRHLADLGARVIKVERIGEGDFARDYDNAVHGMASHFVWLNRGKQSVAVDLKSAERARPCLHSSAGRRVRAQPRTRRRGTARPRRGDLRAGDPRLVVVNISGYGTAGPFEDRKAYDMLVQAETGLMLGHRYPGDRHQDRHPDLGHRRRHVRLHLRARCAVPPRTHR